MTQDELRGLKRAEAIRRAEANRLRPKPTIKPTPPEPVPLPRPPRPVSGQLAPGAVTQDQQLDRVLSYLPDYLNTVQSYMQTGRLDRTQVMALDKAFEGFPATARMDRQSAGQLLYQAANYVVWQAPAPFSLPALNFLRAGRATHPDEAEVQIEYDVMIGAAQEGTKVQEAIRIAESHLTAHRKASQPEFQGTQFDPFPGQPEKNQQAVVGFTRVLAELRGKRDARPSPVGEPGMRALDTPFDLAQKEIAGALGFAYEPPPPGIAARVASFLGESWMGSPNKWVADKLMGDPSVRAFSRYLAAGAVPALASGGALAGLASLGAAEIAELGEAETLLGFGVPAAMPKKLRGLLDEATKLAAKGEKLTPVMEERLLAEAGLLVTTEDVGRPIIVAGRDGVLSGVEGNLARVTLPEGRTITVSANSLVKAPSAGWGTDMATEAAGLRAGKVVEDSHPLQVTPGGLLGEPAGGVALHGTNSTAERLILEQGGLAPSVPGTGTFRAVYTTSDDAMARSHANVTAKLRGGEPRTLAVEVPSSPRLISYDDADALRRELGLGNSPRDWDRLSTLVRERGFDGVDLAGSGAHKAGDVAWLRPNAVRPVAGGPNSWDDFVEVAKGVMAGDARVFVLNPVSGGAAGTYSPALETLTKFVTNNSFDKQQLMLSMSRAAKTVEFPEGTVGKVFSAAQRPFNPSVGKMTREAFFASYAHQEVEQTAFAVRMLFLQKAVQETLGRQALGKLEGTPFTHLFRGTMPKSDAARRTVGSFVHMVENMEKYDLPANWRGMAEIWQAALSNDFKLMQDMGYPGELIQAAYVPHSRVEVAPSFLDNFFKVRGGTGTLPSRLGFARQRKYTNIEEWADFLAQHGEVPELDPFKLYARRLLSTARLRTTQVYIQGLLKAYGQPIPKGKTPLPGWTEILPGSTPPLGTAVPGVRTGRWAVPEDIAREARALLSTEPGSGAGRAIEETVDVFRSTLLSIDLSPITIQGYSLASADPIRFLSGFATKARAALTEEGFILELANNMDSYAKFMRSGGVLYISAIDIVKGLGTTSLAHRLPGIGWINEVGYGRALPMLKRMQWEGMTEMLLGLQQEKGLGQWFLKGLPRPVRTALRKFAGVEGKTTEELAEAAADVINNIGGGINWAKIMTRPTLAGKLIILTEGWVRANIGKIVTAAKVGDPRGVLARRWMFQQLAITASISELLSQKLSGRHVQLDPRETDWLDIQVPGGTISIMPGKTYIRTIVRTIAGKPWDDTAEGRVQEILRFGEGRMGQFIHIGADLKTGKDFFGRPIDDPLLHAGRALLPLAAQAAADMFFDPFRPGPVAVGAQFAGLNFIPTSPYEARDTFIQSLGWVDELSREPVENYFDLSEAQRKAIDEKWPEYTQAVRDWQRVTDRPINALNEQRALTIASVEALGKAFLGKPLAVEEKETLGPVGANVQQVADNPILYTKMLGAIQGAYYAATPFLVEEPDEEEEESLTNQVTQGYYKQVVEPSLVGGVIDSDVFYDREFKYRDAVEGKFGALGLAILDRELKLHSTDDPVAAGYHADSREWAPYYRRRRDYWSPENATQFGIDPAMARQYESFGSYKDAARIATTQELTGKPLDPSIGNYRSRAGGDTLYKRFGIRSGQPLTQQQANEIAEELVRLNTQKYQDALTYNMETWLIENPATLCNLAYWGRLEPTERVRPHLALCPRR